MREGSLHLLLVVLAATAPVLYEARVPTFGCNSTLEVAELLKLRADQATFQKTLLEQVFSGQCLPIEQGAVVEGAVDANDPTMLHVGRNVDPPGYLVPVNDFRVKGDAKTAGPKAAPAATAPAGDKK
jgi:hypothetical protein